MLILQKPEGYCFEKNIPDIILQKENAETMVDVTLKLGATVILEENYKFDTSGLITIRRIDEIVSAYLVAQKNVVAGNVITTGLMQKFSVELNSGETQDVEIQISSSITTKIFFVSYDGILTDIVSVGDKVKSVGTNTYTDVYIQSIDINAKIITLTNSVTHSNGDSFIFEHGINDLFEFSAYRCEADMPSDVNAGIFVEQNFLTRLPREKRTATNRNEYLSYIHFGLYANVIVKYKAYYISDGIYSNKEGDFLTIASGDGDRYVTFNASIAALRTAAALPTEEILQYDLWFTEAAESIDSNVFSFLVDYNHYRNKFHFVFENSFGVLETFTATGLTESKISNEYTLANIQSHYRKTSQDFVSEKTCNSGFLSSDEMEWINDILLSYNVGTYTPGMSGISEEITLTGNEKTDTDENTLQAFKFSYRRAKNNHLQFVAAALGIFDSTYDQTYN